MMKKGFVFGMIGVVALFSVPVAPAFASELSAGQEPLPFQALSGLPDGRQIELTAMTDEQLAAVEGEAFFWGHRIKAVAIWHLRARLFKAVGFRPLNASVHTPHLQRPAARIWQVNVNASRANNTHQSNSAFVFQRH